MKSQREISLRLLNRHAGRAIQLSIVNQTKTEKLLNRIEYLEKQVSFLLKRAKGMRPHYRERSFTPQ